MMNSHDIMVLGVAAVCLAANFSGAFFTVRKLYVKREMALRSEAASHNFQPDADLIVNTKMPRIRIRLVRDFWIRVALTLGIVAAFSMLYGFSREYPATGVLDKLSELERIGISIISIICSIFIVDFAVALIHVAEPGIPNEDGRKDDGDK